MYQTESNGRPIPVHKISEVIADLCVKANTQLPADIVAALEAASDREESPTGREILSQLTANAQLAKASAMAICQDTGMAVVFLKIGQDVHFTDGDLRNAVDLGVAEGYRRGNLRASVVRDPLIRDNTGDNTPAVLHVEIVPGDRVEITVAPKGFGSENMSAIRMLTPSAGVDGVRQFVLDAVSDAGANPCPPVVIGIGIGGSFEQVAYLAKTALLRPVGQPSKDESTARLEKDLLIAVNRLGIGPAGFGGSTTALGLAIETAPTHIAGLPVALNMGCHATRHAQAVL